MGDGRTISANGDADPGAQSAATEAASGPPADPGLEPLTLSLLGRFFGTPLLIISIIVTGAVLVVFLFGGPATESTRSVESLLQTLEASSGARSMGILLPREKELWQAALELGQRLKNRSAEFSDEEIETTATRLAAMVRLDIGKLDELAETGVDAAARHDIRSTRLRFLIHALGRTESELAVEPLLDIVRNGNEPFVAAAIQELGDTPRLVGFRPAIDAVSHALTYSTRAETQLVACTVLSVLAEPGDRVAIDSLTTTLLRHEGEVAWSAALALARLGNDAGKSTLMDLLDRKFLQSPDLYVVTDAGGNVLGRYAFPPERVNALMIAAIDAASDLNDAGLWEMIKRLESDASLEVRGRAVAVLAGRT